MAAAVTATLPSSLTGGCQCGAVRYRLEQPPRGAHICHCRMCQKAVGGFYAALAVVDADKITWTCGKPTIFNSSEHVERGFCARCGTPMTYLYAGNNRLNFTIASLDDPALVKPAIQIGIESRMPWHGELPGLPEHTTDEFMTSEKRKGMGASRQHPDHD